MGGQPKADWYDDPERPGSLRYWDGEQWTEHRHAWPELGASVHSTPKKSELPLSLLRHRLRIGGLSIPTPLVAFLAVANLIAIILLSSPVSLWTGQDAKTPPDVGKLSRTGFEGLLVFAQMQRVDASSWQVDDNACVLIVSVLGATRGTRKDVTREQAAYILKDPRSRYNEVLTNNLENYGDGRYADALEEIKDVGADCVDYFAATY